MIKVVSMMSEGQTLVMILRAKLHAQPADITNEQVAEIEEKLLCLKPILEEIGFEFCECPPVEIQRDILAILQGNHTHN